MVDNHASHQNTQGATELKNLICVCICCFNASNTIAEAIESVLGQTHSNFELLIIDDGSTDSSATIINAYAQKDKRIRYVHQLNKGIGVTRNRAVEESDSVWLAYLDADDVWHPEKLKLQLQLALSATSPDAVISNSFSIQSQQDNSSYFTPVPTGSISSRPVENLLQQLLIRNFNFHPASVLWNTEKLKCYGSYSHDRNGEDFQPFLQLALANGLLIRIEHPLYGSRETDGSLSRSSNNHYLGAIARVNAIQWVLDASERKQIAISESHSQLLRTAKQRFVRWALYGARQNDSKKMRITLSDPLFNQLESNSTRLLERLKLLHSLLFR